jgi:hypothetical protein
MIRIKYYFKGQFILFSVVQAPGFGGQVAKIFFHEDHRRLELHVNRFLTVIRQLVVVAKNRQILVKSTLNDVKLELLFNGQMRRNFRPQASVFDRSHRLLRISIHVHVEQQPAERGAQLVRKAFIRHALEDQIDAQVIRQAVDGQVLPVQTHVREQIQLMAIIVQNGLFLYSAGTGPQRQMSQFSSRLSTTNVSRLNLMKIKCNSPVAVPKSK